jgi:hypothetical protein
LFNKANKKHKKPNYTEKVIMLREFFREYTLNSARMHHQKQTDDEMEADTGVRKLVDKLMDSGNDGHSMNWGQEMINTTTKSVVSTPFFEGLVSFWIKENVKKLAPNLKVGEFMPKKQDANRKLTAVLSSLARKAVWG